MEIKIVNNDPEAEAVPSPANLTSTVGFAVVFK